MHCAMKSRLPKQGMPRWSPMKGYLQMCFYLLVRFARLYSCQGHFVLGVSKPCVVKHVCTSTNKKNAFYHVFLGVKCNKTPLFARICTVL